MGHPLDSIAAKLDGAEGHLHRLQERMRAGAVTDLVETAQDRDRRGRVRIRVARLTAIPDEWHVWIGECVHDLRSALDHLAYALNVAGSGQDPPANERASAFPIFSERCAYRGARGAANMVRCFPRGARTRVERLQPYHRGSDPETRELWVLRELADIDKHRRFPITTATNQTMVGPAQVVEGHDVAKVQHRYGRLHPGATIMWLTVPTLPLDVREPRVGFGIGAELEFERDNPRAPLPLEEPHEPVVEVLESILEFIRGRVMPELDSYLAQLF